MSLPLDKQARKERPIARGVLDYFPDAIAEIAHVSFVGNQQHNPGEPLHWARGKSADHADCVARHLIERGTVDDDGMRHSAKAAWRALAMLQIELEEPANHPPREAKDKIDWIFDKSDPRNVHSIYVNTVGDQDDYDLSSASEGRVVAVPHPSGLYSMTIDEEEVFRPERGTYQHGVYAQCLKLGCRPGVAAQIARGTTYTRATEKVSDRYVYIAGPMRGYEKFNFPSFDIATGRFADNGWNVVSPADIDRNAGCTEDTPPEQVVDQRVFVYRDFFALYFIAHQTTGAIAMLSGWERSTGAVAEFFLARWLGLKVLDAMTGDPLKELNKTALITSINNFLIGQLQKETT